MHNREATAAFTNNKISHPRELHYKMQRPRALEQFNLTALPGQMMLMIICSLQCNANSFISFAVIMFLHEFP